MTMQDKKAEPEIVIVRRKRGGDDDCHHGGVWKVAYADFMTAMMAFFLVMWLINAANEATRSQVASYFNPVKLVDTSTNPRGIEDSSHSSSGDVENKKLKNVAESKAGEKTGNGNDDKKKAQEKKKGPAAHMSGGDIPENELFRDPVHTLDKIAGGAPDLLKGAARPASRDSALGAQGGEQFRDPFSPQSWEGVNDLSVQDERNGREGGPDVFLEDGGEKKKTARGKRKKQQTRTRQQHVEMRLSGRKKEGAKHSGAIAAKVTREDDGRKVLLGKIRAQLMRELAHGDKAHLPDVMVRKTSEGILISLTDRNGFGMFQVGSAKPRRETVRFMERVARILKDKPGSIVVRGHTDGRPFRTDLYDNWRLSTARAHAARYMLLRGGIADSRIIRIEGYADRKLAVPGDPLAARNMRIEILLKSNSRARLASGTGPASEKTKGGRRK